MKKRKRRSSPQVMEAPPRPSEDYEARNALETLTRSHEIQGDKHLMKRVKAHCRKQQESHARILRLEDKEL